MIKEDYVSKNTIMTSLDYVVTFSTLMKNLVGKDPNAFEDGKVRSVFEDLIGPKNYFRLNEEYKHRLIAQEDIQEKSKGD